MSDLNSLDPSPIHIPVLLEEVMSFCPSNARRILDGTLGEAGHMLEFRRRFPNARCTGVDRDPMMLERARKRLNDPEVTLLRTSFQEAASSVPGPFDFILLDLGVSMVHFRGAARGFSFADENLDMRLDPDLDESAEDVVNSRSERELETIFSKLGEERYSRRIAQAIVKNRPVRSAVRLAEIIKKSTPPGKVHPATRVFQALRIYVNKELEQVEKSIQPLAGILAKGGRLAIISFHSLEDRIVKNEFKSLAQKSRDQADYAILTKKPIIPTEEEISRNHASRSAKLRVLERLTEN